MEKLKLNIQQFASGTISGGTYNARYSYFMTWTSVSNGSIENTSNVTLNWVFKKTATDSYNAFNTSGSSKVTLVINGSSSGSLRADFDLRSAAVGTEKVIATYTVNKIPHNANGTCTINVSGSHVTGLNWGTKSIGNTAITLDTIPRYATCSQSLDSANSTETSLRINWSSDSTIDYVWYSKDGGSNWTAVGSVNASSGNYTISGLSAGTSYSIKTRVRRKDSQLTTDSSANPWVTFSYPYINTVGTVNLTIGSPQTLTLYNPKGRSVTVYMKHNNTSGTQIYSGSTSSTTIQFTPTASTMYNLIPNAKSGNCVYYVVYGGNTSATKSGTFVVNENNNKPSVTSYTPYDNNTRTYNLTGDRNKIVLNASTMQLTIVANAKNNATFNNNGYIKVNGTSLELTISGNTATGVYTITRPSSATFSIELKDSRGIITPTSYTLTNYVNYFTPTFVGSAVRNQPTDGIINLSGRGTFFNGSFGSQSNTITVHYGVFDLATQEQLTIGTFTVTTSGNNHTEEQVQVSGADYQKQWAVLFQVVDKFISTSSTVQVPKGVPIFNWDEDEFDVNVNLLSRNKQLIGQHKLDLTSLSSSNFYPVTFYSFNTNLGVGEILDCEIHSQGGGSAQPYNQNLIHFQLYGAGWSDTPSGINILSYRCFDNGEITIGCVGLGNNNAYDYCVWLRGGLRYLVNSNYTPALHTANYTTGNSTFSVGTNYYGGTNTNVSIWFTPQSTITNGMYLSHNFTVANGLRVNGTTTSNDYSGGIWGKTNDVATNNTTDTWVPVMSGTKWQHRAIPTTYNSTAPTLTGLTLNGDNGSNNITKSGVIENQTSFESDTFKKQSFVGSTNVSGTWYNIINCRHRNGGGDGTNFGMQIRKKLTSNGALEIRTQLASTTWTSWQRIPVEFVLYDNSTGTNGNVTLSETAANFTYIEIYFRDNNSSEFHCEKIYSPNGKSTTIGFIRNYADSGGVLYSYLFSKYITISGTTITNVRNDYTQFRAKVVNDHNANNNVYIFRVVGYR